MPLARLMENIRIILQNIVAMKDTFALITC